jgi:hypothetical protein
VLLPLLVLLFQMLPSIAAALYGCSHGDHLSTWRLLKHMCSYALEG